MNILLITIDNSNHYSYFSLGTAYIAAALRENHNVSIYSQDYHHYSEEHLKNYIENNNFNIIGIGSISGYYTYKKLKLISKAINKCKNRKDFLYVLGGHMPSADPEYFLAKMEANAIIKNEGELSILKLIRDMKPGIYESPQIQDLDNIPRPAYDLFPIEYYRLQRLPNIGITDFSMSVITGRGCGFNCLEGDTIVDTLEFGKQKIKDLVGKNIKVLTRNKVTKDLEYAKAYNISLTKQNSELVRVHFDDNTYIDCTPDHKFLVFENGNQYQKSHEVETEAKDLVRGNSVKAIKYVIDKQGYVIIKFGRGKRRRYHRLLIEGKLERKLTNEEVIHHINAIKDDNRIENLVLTTKNLHTKIYHQKEVSEGMKRAWKNGIIKTRSMSEENKKKASERMKLNNPAFNYTDKWKNNISKANKGKKRSLEAKNNYRLSKLGNKNPMFGGLTQEHKNKLSLAQKIKWLNPEYRLKQHLAIEKNKKEINHKIVKVEKLSDKKDVYCMEIPGYDWFFANNVLVHNCSFCYRSSSGIRLRGIQSIIDEIQYLKDTYNISYIDFADDLTMASKERAIELSEALIPLNIKWRCEGRLNFVTEDILKVMKRAGCVFINYGIESLDNNVLVNIKKGLTEDLIIKGIELTLKIGISPGLNMLFNLPGDNIETLKKAVNFLIKYDDNSQLRTIGFVQPYPGSELFNIAKAKGLVKDTEDFFEKKLQNNDLLSCNFMDITDDEAYKALYSANFNLLTNYYKNKIYASEKQLKQLYINKDTNWRGYRHA